MATGWRKPDYPMEHSLALYLELDCDMSKEKSYCAKPEIFVTTLVINVLCYSIYTTLKKIQFLPLIKT